MARRLSPAQIKAGFGGKRRQNASRKRRARPKSNPRRHKAKARVQHHRKRTAPRRKARRSNPGEIISLTLGNPAKRRHKVAAKRRRKSASGRHRNAGSYRRRKMNPARVHHRRRRHSNPAGMGAMDLVALGGGAVVGSAVPKVASQFVLGSSNTGWMGYAANLAGTFVLAWGAGKFARGKAGQTFAIGIIAGGIGSVLSRIISDYSLLGPYGQSLGVGDYMVSNWVTPQRMVDGLNSAMIENGWNPPVTAMVQAGNGMGMYAPLYG